MGILFRRGFWMLMTGFASLGLSKIIKPTDFSFDSSGVSNRLITPNGDSRNETVVLTFSNPRDSSISGKIYDMRGALVATMSPGPSADTTLQWDGRSNGVAVPGGVYVYVLQGEGKVFTGTVVVIR